MLVIISYYIISSCFLVVYLCDASLWCLSSIMSGQLVSLDLIHRGVGGQQCVIHHTKHTHS